MSIHTDIASLQIIARIYKSTSVSCALKTTVTSLVEKVPYIDWAGIYMYEAKEKKLVAAANNKHPLQWECNGELTFPLIHAAGDKLGEIVVQSKQPIAFDVTDVSTLETVAQTIAEQLFTT